MSEDTRTEAPAQVSGEPTGTEVAAITLKRRKIIASTWWLVWLLGTLWICRLLAIAWPYVHLPPQPVLLITLPGLVYCSVELVWMQVTGRVLVRWRRWAMQIAAVPCGVFLAGFAWTQLDAVSMARFEAAMRPLVEQVHARRADPCPPAANYRIGAALNEYLVHSGAPRTPVGIHHAQGHFVLVLVARSIDIDGSIVFYDSAAKDWVKFHTDSRAAAEDLDSRVKGMQSCRIPLR